MPNIKWNEEKNNKIRQERGIGFEDVVCAIEEGRVLGFKKHHNQERYPGQMVIIVKIQNYARRVPFVEEDSGSRFLKTMMPSRKETKLYLLQ